MGKASRELNLAREAIYKQETPNDENNNIDYTKPTDNLFEENIAHEIQQAMIKYTSNNSYALCEYLDLINITNFIHWCKTR